MLSALAPSSLYFFTPNFFTPNTEVTAEMASNCDESFLRHSFAPYITI
ncbi:MAG: hypothetical protein R2850_13750 [Bacteroidia bacterium]